MELFIFAMTIFNFSDYRNSFRIFFVIPPKVKKRSNNPNLYKETKNNKLKDSGGWRKMTSSNDRL